MSDSPVDYVSQLQSLFEKAPLGLLIVDDSGVIISANLQAKEILGYQGGVLAGQPVEQLIDESLRVTHVLHRKKYFVEPIARPMAAGKSFQARKLDGSTVDVQIGLSPLYANGKTMATCFVVDMTEHHRIFELEQALKVAGHIQERLYPACPPAVGGLDCAASVLPAEALCGDYFDYIALDGNRLAVVIGDVSGHGLGSALQMVQARAYLNAYLETETELAEVIDRFNARLVADSPLGSFVSLFVGVLSLSPTTLSYVGAGHDAWLLRAGEVHRLESTCMVAGLVPDSRASTETTGLESGDVMLMMTDGVNEAWSPDGEMFGTERALDVLRNSEGRSAEETVQGLLATIKEFAHCEQLVDDATAMVIKVQ